MNVNSQYFDREQIEAGEMHKLLDVLMAEAYGEGKYYNDIHLKPADCGAFVIEWAQIPWDGSFGGSFQYIAEDEAVMIEREFPDGHAGYFFGDDDFRDALADWLGENPGWVKTSYGTWTNEIENAKFLKSIGESQPDGQQPHYENGVPQGE